MMRRALALLVALGVVAAGPAGTASGEPADRVSHEHTVTVSDGTELAATLETPGEVAPRPTVVEFSPYGRDSESLTPGAHYNSLLVQIRGTGDSHGSFDALGPRTQRDVVQVLRWACRQPWSNGRLAVAGFSASAITIYNSMHRRLPCVEAMVLKSGTFELYRDLLVPGGVSNLVPAAGVMGLIGAPAVRQLPDRDPSTVPDWLLGMAGAGVEGGVAHPTLDRWWRRRGFRGDANRVPVLILNGFFDVESRGAFQAFRALRDHGAHLVMYGGHDGVPEGSDGGQAEQQAWLDHYLRGVDNGVEDHPTVQLLLSRGDREDYLAGDTAYVRGRDWPLPRTEWTRLHLAPRRSGTATSLNDGSLTLRRPGAATTQAYPAVYSVPTNSDVPNAAILGAAGFNTLSESLPLLTDMTLAESVGLTFTTAPLRRDVRAAGPLALDLRLATTAPATGIWVVLSDVDPDGVAHPLTVGRLHTDFPGVVREKSLVDGRGRIVQPYGDYSERNPASPGERRRYRVELWPVGNEFERGHRIRVQLVGASAASRPTAPGVNQVVVGGRHGASLLFPTIDRRGLAGALGGG